MTALFPLATSIFAAWEAWARSLDALPPDLAYSPEDMEIALARPVPPGFLLGGGGVDRRLPGGRFATVGDVVATRAHYGPAEVVSCGCGWCMKGDDRPHNPIPGWRIRPRAGPRMVVGWRWWSERSSSVLRAAVVPSAAEVAEWTAAGLTWDGPVQHSEPCRLILPAKVSP